MRWLCCAHLNWMKATASHIVPKPPPGPGGPKPIEIVKQLNVNLDLVKKYNMAGPRYTSYQPKTNTAPTWSALVEMIAANIVSEDSPSLYFHLPFCETLCPQNHGAGLGFDI
jgi:hypothetical protein